MHVHTHVQAHSYTEEGVLRWFAAPNHPPSKSPGKVILQRIE